MGILKRVLIGKPLKNNDLEGEKFGILWGLPILSSDAISSVAYAGQEILLVLVPVIGMLAFKELTFITAAIITLLIILTLSYSQTIDSYPNGGGAFIVAKENLGVVAGVAAGSALSIGYILTVAVSITSGVDQLVSAFKILEPYRILLCLFIIILMSIGNLRGIKESAKIFSIPTYLFVLSILIMLIVGLIKVFNGHQPEIPIEIAQNPVEPVTLFLVLKAFTSGCAALTGVEAVSNSVPNFKEPSTKNAKKVLYLLSALVLIVFGGTSVIVNYYPINPEGGAMLVQIAGMVFGNGSMFYYIVAGLSFAILVLAANTAYVGFPNFISVMAKEGYVPRQLSMRGDRLSYSNGILVLSAIAMILIIAFKANITTLIGLYAIGVFISFTLSQVGMCFKWIRLKCDKWVLKAAINGFGALITFCVVIVIAITKFTQGTWIVVIIMPLLIFMMLRVKKHYAAVRVQLKVKPVEFNLDHYKNRVICPIQSINKASLRAIKYARTISDNVVALCIATDEEEGKEMQKKYEAYNLDVPLIIKYSPFRKVVEPLIEFIQSEEYHYNRGDMITVMLAKFTVKRWWHMILHNHTQVFIQRQLLKHKHIVVATIPLQLKDDDDALERYQNVGKNS